MSIRNSIITTDFISDFASGRLDAEDAQIIQEAINHDEVIATAVADACRVNARMHLWLATSTAGASAGRPVSSRAGGSHPALLPFVDNEHIRIVSSWIILQKLGGTP